MNPYSIPFEIPGDFTNSSGILSLVDQALNMEFQTKDGFVGIVKSEVKKTIIPLTEIMDIRFKKSWFGGGKILLQVGKMELFKDVPGHEAGMIRLKVKKQFRDNAMNLVAEITYVAAENSLASIKSRL
ncbi:hypothetical protein OAM01_01210 [bacterium]|nr:hypothetical protein [bacterium]